MPYNQQDVYSLGVCFFTMLTSFPPYSRLGDNYYRVIQNGLPLVKRMLADWNCTRVHEEALDLCLRMLRQDPAHRITIVEVQEILEKLSLPTSLVVVDL